MKITIRKSWTNVKFLTKNVSSDEKPERIYELIEEYTKLSEVEVCPSILFINIKNQTETDWITDNVEVIIEYLRTVNDENDLNTEKRKRKWSKILKAKILRIQCWTFVWENANMRNKINIVISLDLLMIGMVKLNISYITRLKNYH